MKKDKVIATILILAALAVGIFYKFGVSHQNSNATKNDNLVQIIQNQDSKAFLKLFDKKTTESSISEIGAKSVLNDWNQNSKEDLNEIPVTLKNGGKVSGSNNNYHIKYEETTKMLFMKQSKPTTMTSKLIVPSKLKRASIKVDGKSVSYSDLTKNNLFPGVYNFKVKLDKDESTQKVTILGDGRSVTLLVPKKQVTTPKVNVEKPSNKKIDNSNTDNNKESKPSNNDPTYKDAAQLTSSDLVGTWDGVDGENDPVGALPEKIVFTATTISVQRAHSIQNNMNIGSAKYSENDGLMVFYSDDDVDMPNGFAVKLVKRQYNGQERVMLEQDDQGMTGWYVRQ